MKTITAEEFKKKYGEVGLTQMFQPKSPDTSYLGRVTEAVGTDINTRVEKTSEILNRPKTGIVEKGTQLFGQGAGLAANTLEKTIGEIPGVKQAVGLFGSGVNWLATSELSPVKHLGDIIGENKALQEVTTLYDNDKNFKDTIDAVANIARLGLDVSAAVKSGAYITNVTNKLSGGIVRGAVGGVKQVVKGGQELLGKSKQGLGVKIEKFVAEPIQKQYETTLQRTTLQKFDEYANVAKKAAQDFKEQTPLQLAGQKAQSALDTIQRKLKAIGEQKNGVLNQAVVGNKNVGNIVVKFRQNLQRYLGNKTAVEGDTKLLNDISNEAAKLGGNPTAKQVDKFIDFIQDRIYTSGRDLTVPVTDSATGALRQMTGQLNESLKTQLPNSYRGLNQKYADMVGVRNELNIKLGKAGEQGGSLMKRVFSPSDANTKKLFEKVKILTGVDLVDEATLARLMMEIAGDSRQASILQQLDIPQLTSTSILGRAWKEIVKRYNTPEMRLKRARELLLKK